MTVRPAAPADTPRMAQLSDQKRSAYEQYAPTFWRKAEGAVERQTPYFADLLKREDVIALVHETDTGIDGFVIATLASAPPVYDPGTRVIIIDDFTVATPDLWPSAGAELLSAVRQRAQERGAGMTVVVCGHLDGAKRDFLRDAGFGIASEWYVNPL